MLPKGGNIKQNVITFEKMKQRFQLDVGRIKNQVFSQEDEERFFLD